MFNSLGKHDLDMCVILSKLCHIECMIIIDAWAFIARAWFEIIHVILRENETKLTIICGNLIMITIYIERLYVIRQISVLFANGESQLNAKAPLLRDLTAPLVQLLMSDVTKPHNE